jgi:hypothetical protein
MMVSTPRAQITDIGVQDFGVRGFAEQFLELAAVASHHAKRNSATLQFRRDPGPDGAGRAEDRRLLNQ